MRVELEIGDALKPGVYLLRRFGKVVFVGRARCLLTTITAHRTACGEERLPEWFPIKAIQFDGVSIIPCPYGQAGDLVEELVAIHHPVHNIHSGPKNPILLPLIRRRL